MINTRITRHNQVIVEGLRDLPEAWRAVMAYVDEFMPRPSISISPITTMEWNGDGEWVGSFTVTISGEVSVIEGATLS